jgi:iron complex outermembrane receptor protein
MKLNWFGATAAAALMVSCMSAAPTLAQAATAADNAQLPEVIVQARRIDENQQKVPVAVTTLSAKTLEQATVTQINDIQSLAPSLTIDPGSLGGSADPTFSLRGLSGNLVADPSVVTYFDQVVSDPRNFAYQTYDLSSVEVLKGAQGTLFGKNSTGGAVLFAPARPGREMGGFVDVRYGNYNDREVTGALNLPFSDVVWTRIAANVERRDGTVDSVTGGFKYNTRDHESMRVEVVFKPNDHFENYLQGTLYQVREMGNQPFLTGVAACPNPFAPQPAPQCFFESPLTFFLGTTDIQQELAQQQALGRDKTVNSFRAPFNVDFGGLTDIATANFGAITVKNILHFDTARYHTAYDLTGTGAGLLDQDDFQSNRYITEEFQVLGKAFDNHLSWLLGYYYSDFTLNENETFNLVSFPGNPVSPQIVSLTEPQRSTALFGQATYDLSNLVNGLSVTGGYRYTWDDKSITQSRFANSICALTGYPGLNPVTCIEQVSTGFSNNNYNVSLNWQATPQTLIYVATRRGYKAGGFNFASTDPAFLEYKPETVTDYELGVKSDFKLGDMPVRANAAIYEGKYDNIQAQFVSVSPIGLPEALIVNQDPITGTKNKATLTGGEAEVTIIPMHGLTATAFYGYAQGKYDQFVNSTSGTPISLAGQQIDGIAKNTAGFSVNYTPSLPDGLGRPTATAVLYYRSKLSSNSLNPSLLSGFTTLDLRLDWRDVAGQPVDIALYGKNVTNKRYPTINDNLISAVGVTSEQLNEPAMFGVELRYHFGAQR